MTTLTQQTTIYWKRGTWTVLALLATAAVLMGLYIAASANELGATIVGLIVVLIFGRLAILSLKRARERRPVLVFTPEGIDDPTGLFMLGHLDWSKVDRVATANRTFLFPIRRIRIDISPDAAAARGLSAAATATLFLRTRSLGARVRVLSFGTESDRELRESLVSLAPPSILIT